MLKTIRGPGGKPQHVEAAVAKTFRIQFISKRSGRDGKLTLCEVLANRDNIHVLENFIYGDTPEKHSIFQLLRSLKGNKDFVWEIKPVTLSNDLNIRILPS